MKLKSSYASKDEIPEGAESFFTEQSDGSYKLNLDGGVKTQADVDKVMTALEAERDAHKETKKKIKDLPDDFDAEKWDKVKDLDPDKAGKGTEDVEAVKAEYAQKLKDQKAEYEAKIEERDSRYNNTLKERELRDHLMKKGITNPIRLDDAVTRIMRHHDVQVVEDGDKSKVVAGPLRDSIDDFTASWVTTDEGKNYVSASGNDGGGAGNDGGGGGTDPNPWKKETFNLTKQMQITDDNPDKAKRMMQAAGV